jgi:hypothetical protein
MGSEAAVDAVVSDGGGGGGDGGGDEDDYTACQGSEGAAGNSGHDDALLSPSMRRQQPPRVTTAMPKLAKAPSFLSLASDESDFMKGSDRSLQSGACRRCREWAPRPRRALVWIACVFKWPWLRECQAFIE